MVNSYLQVDLNAIRENYRNICRRANAPVLAVVKANAYGHGAVAVAKALTEENCPFFGVANMPEALELRENGITAPILILGRVHPDCYPEAVKQEIRVPVFSLEDGKALSRAAQDAGKTALFHFAVDTGMSRIGFQVTEEDADLCKQIAELPMVEAEGLFSHFATADEWDQSRTLAQAEQYEKFRLLLAQRGITPPVCHLDNSAGIMNYGAHYQMVRAGIILYGIYPSHEVDTGLLALRPAASWHSTVTFVKDLEPGRQISYGGTFTAEKPMRVATVAIGYADGYNRRLSGRFSVLIRGEQAKILGRVCMDQILVDVTDIPGVAVDDDVTLIGKDGCGEITADQMAEALDTIPYEVLCLVGNRTLRRYI